MERESTARIISVQERDPRIHVSLCMCMRVRVRMLQMDAFVCACVCLRVNVCHSQEVYLRATV